MVFAQNPRFFQFGSNRQLDRIADICYLNCSRQYPDESCRWVAYTATYCDSSAYIHNLKFFLNPLSKREFLSNQTNIKQIDVKDANFYFDDK